MLQVAIYIVVSQVVAQRDIPTRELEAIAQASEAHRLSFRFGTIRFTESVGHAKNLADAISGAWIDRFDATGVCLFDESHAKYECIYSLEILRKFRRKIDVNRWESLSRSRRLLTDSKSTLFHDYGPVGDADATAEISQIADGSNGFWMEWDCPLEIGRPEAKRGLTFMAAKLQRGDSGVTLTKVSHTRGGVDDALCDISFRTAANRPPGLVVLTNLRIDLAHGSVPIEYRLRREGDVDDDLIVINSDIRSASGKGWLPYRTTVFHPASNFVRVFQIVDANLNDPPGLAEFRMQFDRPIVIRDQKTLIEYGPTTSFDFANRPPARPRNSAPIGTGAEAPRLSGEIETRPQWPVATAAVGCVLLTVYFAIRRWRA